MLMYDVVNFPVETCLNLSSLPSIEDHSNENSDGEGSIYEDVQHMY